MKRKRTMAQRKIWEPGFPELLNSTIIHFDPDLPPAAFPTKWHGPDESASITSGAVAPSQLGFEMDLKTDPVSGEKRKKDKSTFGGMQTFEEIQDRGFSVYVDRQTSNGPDNPVWKANIELLSKQQAPSSKEDVSQTSQAMLVKGQDEMGTSPLRAPQHSASDAVGSAINMNIVPSIEFNGSVEWKHVAEVLQLSIYTNLVDRYSSAHACTSIGLNKADIKRLSQAVETYNREVAAEDEALEVMRRDQLNAILRGDTTKSFEDISQRHISWMHDHAKTSFNVCTREDLHLAVDFLRSRGLDPGLLDEWDLPTLTNGIACDPKTSASEVGRSIQKLPRKRQVEGSDAGSIAADVMAEDLRQGNMPPVGKQEALDKDFEPVQRRRRPLKQLNLQPSTILTAPVQKVMSSSPLKNEILPVESPVPRSGRKKRSLTAQSTSQSVEPSRGTTSSAVRKRASSGGLHREPPVRISPVRHQKGEDVEGMQSPMTSRQGASASPQPRDPSLGGRLRARSELKPTRAAVEGEESYSILRHRGGELLEEAHDNENVFRGQTKNDSTRKVVNFKFGETGKAFLKALASGADPVNLVGPGSDAPTADDATPHPTLQSQNELTANSVDRSPNAPILFKPTPMNDFMRQLLTVSQEDLETSPEQKYNLQALPKESASGFSPAQPPLSEQGNPLTSSNQALSQSRVVENDHNDPKHLTFSSSPGFAVTVKNPLKAPDPGSPLVSRSSKIPILLTPTTSPVRKRIEDDECDYSPSEASDAVDENESGETSDSAMKMKSKKSVVKKSTSVATPRPSSMKTPPHPKLAPKAAELNVEPPKRRSYTKSSPFWTKRSQTKGTVTTNASLVNNTPSESSPQQADPQEQGSTEVQVVVTPTIPRRGRPLGSYKKSAKKEDAAA